MPNLAHIGPRAIVPATETPSEATLWERLPQKKRDIALDRQRLIQTAADRVAAGASIKSAAQHLARSLDAGRLPADLALVAKQLGRNGSVPSHQTLARWISAYIDRGVIGLATKNRGSARQPLPCEARALHLFNQGSRPNPGDVTRRLQQEGHSVSYTQLRALWLSLPANQQENSRERIGPTEYANTQGYYTRRTTEGLTVGSCYQSDGNMLPIYLQHPTGERPSRWELTPVIDVASRYLVAYQLEQAESANETLHALTAAILKEGHVPSDFQGDNGPGFRNKRVARYLDQLGIFEAHPRARRPNANGHIERWHRTMKNELLKFLPGYCGKDGSPELQKKFLAEWEKGKTQLLTVEQFKHELDNYLLWYNSKRGHSDIGGKAPATLWATLERHAPGNLEDVMFWELEERTVSRGSIKLLKREYTARELYAYNGRKVLVEFNLLDDRVVRVRECDERWICDAQIIRRADYRSQSFIKDREQIKEASKARRLAKKAEEQARRSARTIDVDTTPILEQLATQEIVQMGGLFEINSEENADAGFDFMDSLPAPEHPDTTQLNDSNLWDE